MKLYRLYILLGITLLIGSAGGCEKESPSSSAIPPSNLSLNVENEEGTGQIVAKFNADKANYYRINFGAENGNWSEKLSGKMATHTYATSGKYTILVRAYATESAYIESSKQVEVNINTESTATEGYTTPESYSGMNLVWQDEFSGTSLNTADWTFEIGTGSGGWGNNELQYYRKENTTVKDGFLTIEARKETFSGQPYTSSRIITKGKEKFKYGRVDIRATMPEGQGIWPALWMLGENISKIGWPACGEIDIMEMIGREDNKVYGTIHWLNNGQAVNYGKSTEFPASELQDKFHVFSIVWTPQEIRWYVDDVQFNVADITPAELSEFQEEFFFIFNVAVGGDWPGNPDASSTYPQKMVVDYIRVFQNQ